MVRHRLSLALVLFALGLPARGEEGPLPAPADNPELQYSQCLKKCATDFQEEEEDAAFCRIQCDNARSAAGDPAATEEIASFPEPQFLPPPPPPGPSMMEILILMMLLSPPKPEPPPRIIHVPIPVPYGMASEPFQSQQPGMPTSTPWGELSGGLPLY